MDTRQAPPTNNDITVAALKAIVNNYQASDIFYGLASLVGLPQVKVNEQIEFERLLGNMPKQADHHYLTADELLPWIDYAHRYHNHLLGKAVANLLHQLNGNAIYGRLLLLCQKKHQLDAALLDKILRAHEKIILALYTYIKKSHHRLALASSIINCAFIMRKESQKKLSHGSIITLIDDLVCINQLNQKTASIIAKRQDAEECRVFIQIWEMIDSCNESLAQPSDLTMTEFNQIIPRGSINQYTIHVVNLLTQKGLINKEVVVWLAKRQFHIHDVSQLEILQYNKLINQHNMEWIRKNESFLSSIDQVFNLLNGYYSLQQLINVLPTWPPYDDDFISKLTQAVKANNVDLIQSAIDETKNTMLPIEDSLAALGLLTKDIRRRLSYFKLQLNGNRHNTLYNHLRHAIHTCAKHFQLTDELLNIIISHYENKQSQMLHAMIDKVWPILNKNKLFSYDNSVLIQKLLKKKSDYYVSIIEKCGAADCAQTLTQKCFEAIINLHYNKLPQIQPTNVIFHDKMKENLSNSFIHIMNGVGVIISNENDNNKKNQGSMASIKKGYINSDKSTVCIKQLHDRYYIYHKSTLKIAKNEVKYHHLLGRNTAFYFTEPNSQECYVVYPWQEGVPLRNISLKERCALPINNRLLAFSTFMQELAALHGLFRLHGDIHSKNVILNIHSNTMSLIDFGLSRKNTGEFSNDDGSRLFEKQASYPRSSGIFTELLLDPEKPSRFSFSGEIYMASFILAELFPELFSISYTQPPSVKRMKGDNVSPLEQAIYHLYSAMRAKHDSRCLATDAVDFCQAVLAQGEATQTEDIDTISKNTLYRTAITMNDALHGRTNRLII